MKSRIFFFGETYVFPKLASRRCWISFEKRIVTLEDLFMTRGYADRQIFWHLQTHLQKRWVISFTTLSFQWTTAWVGILFVQEHLLTYVPGRLLGPIIALKTCYMISYPVITFSMTVRSTLVVLFCLVTYFCILGSMLRPMKFSRPFQCWIKFNQKAFRVQKRIPRLCQSVRQINVYVYDADSIRFCQSVLRRHTHYWFRDWLRLVWFRTAVILFLFFSFYS